MEEVFGKALQQLMQEVPDLATPFALQTGEKKDSIPLQTKLLFGAIQAGDHKAVQNFILKDVSPGATDEHGRSGLHMAALNDHQDIFGALLNRGADPNQADNEGITPLMCASQKGCERIVDMLLEKGVDVTIRNKVNRSAVFYALFNGHVEIAEKLEQKHSCVHDLQEEPLVAAYMRAVSKNWLRVVKFLSEKKCEVSYPNKLQIASQAALCGHTEMLQYFDVDFHEKTKDGRSPLLCAVQNGFIDAVEYMLTKRCDLSNSEDAVRMAIVANHLDILRLLLENGAPVCKPDENEVTPVQLAIVQGTFEMFKYLVEKGCSVEPHKKLGSLSLISASRRKADVLRYLAENEYSIDEAHKESDETPLLAACQNGPFEAVELLLEHGCNPNARNRRGVTPALRAANNNQEEILMLLKEKGATLDLPNTRTGDYAILCAARNKSLSMVRYLAENGCKLDVKDFSGKTVASYAVEKDNVPLLRYLQQKKICLDEPDARGMTPLMAAVKAGSVEAIKQLTSTPNLCNVNHRNMNGGTAMHIAVASGNIKLLKLLHEKGADLSATDHDGNTPLLESLKHKKAYEMLLYLIKNGCDLQATNDLLRSAVHYACTHKMNDALMLLLDFKCPFDLQDRTGMTPFMIGAEQGSEALITILKAVGADVNKRNMKGKSAVHLAAKKGDLKLVQCCSLFGCHLDQEDKDGKTPLIFACARNKPEIVEFLIRKEADVNTVTHKGRTPAHYACKSGSLEILKLLKEKEAQLDACDLDGATPIMLAAGKQTQEVLIFLCEQGCDLHRVDAKMRTALHFAVQGKNESVITFLCEKGLDPNSLDDSGYSPLLLSIKLNHTSILSLLRSKGGIVNEIFDSDSRNAAHFACKEGNLELLKELVRDQVSISSRTADGETCLTIACSNGHEKILKYLLERNLNVNYKMPNGDTALHVAAKKSHLGLIPLLLSKGVKVAEKNNEGDTVLHVLCRKTCSSAVDKMHDFKAQTEEQIDTLKQKVDQGPESMKPSLLKMIEKTRALPETLMKKGMGLIDGVGKNALIEQLKSLLEAGANANEVNGSGKTPLHLACLDGSKQVLKLILTKGAETINQQDSDGETPIFSAVRKGKAKTVQLLIDEGVDLTIVNKNNLSPYSLALCLNDERVVKVLESRNAPFDTEVVIKNTALSAIFKRRNLNHLDFLLAHGFDGKKVENGKTLVHHAVLLGDIRLLQALKAPKYPFVKDIIDQQDNYEDTALHLAIMRGRLDMANVLIKIGCRTDLKNKKGHTVLHVAAIENKLALVKWVCDNCPNSCQPETAEPETHSPLHLAAVKGNLEVFKFLEQKRFSAATKCKDGMNCAHYAAIHGNLHIMQHIRYMSSEAIFTEKNASGFIPLQCAVLNGHEKISSFLHKCKQNLPKCIVLQALALGNQHMVDWVKKKDVHMDAVDPDSGETPLSIAVSSGNFHLVKRYLRNDAFINARDKHGNTPTQAAAAKNFRHIIRILKEHNAQLDIPDNDGDTPLFDCAIGGHIDAMKMLNEFGCNLNHRNAKQRTIVHLACIGFDKKGNLNIVKFAAQREIPLDEADMEGNTGLMYACRQGFKNIIDFLLSRRQCDPNKANAKRSTAAHLAAMAGRSDILDALSQHGARLDAEDDSGATPLMIAVHGNSLDCVKLLAEKAWPSEGSGRDRLVQLAVWATPEVRQEVERFLGVQLQQSTDEQRPEKFGVDVDMKLCEHLNQKEQKQKEFIRGNVDQRTGSAISDLPELPAEASALMQLNSSILNGSDSRNQAPPTEEEGDTQDSDVEHDDSRAQSPVQEDEAPQPCQQQ